MELFDTLRSHISALTHPKTAEVHSVVLKALRTEAYDPSPDVVRNVLLLLAEIQDASGKPDQARQALLKDVDMFNRLGVLDRAEIMTGLGLPMDIRVALDWIYKGRKLTPEQNKPTAKNSERKPASPPPVAQRPKIVSQPVVSQPSMPLATPSKAAPISPRVENKAAQALLDALGADAEGEREAILLRLWGRNAVLLSAEDRTAIVDFLRKPKSGNTIPDELIQSFIAEAQGKGSADRPGP
jgi:hypothetical protein